MDGISYIRRLTPLILTVILLPAFSFGVEPPTFLYHWTTLEKLNAWAKQNDEAGHLIFKFTPPEESTEKFIGPQVDATLHQFIDRDLDQVPRVFAFETPVGSMGYGKTSYTSDLTPIVVTFKIAPDAKVFAIDSAWGKTEGKFNGADLIYHGYDNFSEWIILNPKKIESYSAHPENIRIILGTYRRWIENKETKKLEEMLLLGSDPKNNLIVSEPDRAARILDRYLATDPLDLPRAFRARFDVALPPDESIACSLLLHGTDVQRMYNRWSRPAYMKKKPE